MSEARCLIDATLVGQALIGPTATFIEEGCVPVARPHTLALAVRTDTAFGLPLAAVFTNALQTRLRLQAGTAEAVELVLHEALANAIIHGNLGLGSEGRSAPEAYVEFCEALAERLRDPAAAGRTIQIVACRTKTRLLLAVTDQGEGFTLQPAPVSVEATSGRGLDLARTLATSVAWNQRRRRLVLVFSIVDQDAA